MASVDIFSSQVRSSRSAIYIQLHINQSRDRTLTIQYIRSYYGKGVRNRNKQNFIDFLRITTTINFVNS